MPLIKPGSSIGVGAGTGLTTGFAASDLTASAGFASSTGFAASTGAAATGAGVTIQALWQLTLLQLAFANPTSHHFSLPTAFAYRQFASLAIQLYLAPL